MYGRQRDAWNKSCVVEAYSLANESRTKYTITGRLLFDANGEAEEEMPTAKELTRYMRTTPDYSIVYV
jgi:hypothetical protein